MAAARIHTSPQTLEDIASLLRADLDWTVIGKLAEKNKVSPLVYHSLVTHYPEAIPSGVLNVFKEKMEQTKAWNEKASKFLLDILRLFKKENIQVAPFKGLVFALLVYGDPQLRHSGDIDLLVRREDFLRAKDLLVRNGYDHAYFGNHEVATVQAQLVRFDKSTSVDLHYGLTPHYLETDAEEIATGSRLRRAAWYGTDRRFTNWFFFMDTNPIWKRTGTLTMDDLKVSVLSPEDQLLVAVINGVKEHWNGLSRVADLNELIRSRPALDWEYILENARLWRCEGKLRFALCLAHEIYDTPLPAALATVIANSSVLTPLIRQTIMQFGNPAAVFRHAQDYRFLQVLSTADDLRDRLRYLRYVFGKLKVASRPLSTLKNVARFLGSLMKQSVMIGAARLGIDLDLKI